MCVHRCCGPTVFNGVDACAVVFRDAGEWRCVEISEVRECAFLSSSTGRRQAFSTGNTVPAGAADLAALGHDTPASPPIPSRLFECGGSQHLRHTHRPGSSSAALTFSGIGEPPGPCKSSLSNTRCTLHHTPTPSLPLTLPPYFGIGEEDAPSYPSTRPPSRRLCRLASAWRRGRTLLPFTPTAVSCNSPPDAFALASPLFVVPPDLVEPSHLSGGVPPGPPPPPTPIRLRYTRPRVPLLVAAGSLPRLDGIRFWC